MTPRTKKRLLLVTVLPLLLALGAELYLRTQVPTCGVTPFRISQRAGLASEFRPGFTTTYKGFEVSYNSDGYRGPELPQRAEGLPRIALVGDSFVYGSAVDLPDTLAVRLERALGEAQVLNLGVPGYSAENVAAVVQHDALRLDPDIVLYVYFANDSDPPSSFESIPEDAVIDGMYQFPGHSALLQWINVRVKHLALTSFGVQLARLTPADSRTLWENGGGQRVRGAIENMRDLCAAKGIRFLVAGYPYLTLVEQNPFRPLDEGAAAVCAELGVEWVDLVEAFDGERDLSSYWASVFDTHPNGAANAKAAAHLAPYLLAK